MSNRYLTRERVRRVDRIAIEQFGIPGLVLMENAGRACADVLCRCGIDGNVLICCGKGNNGGDGLVIARHLMVRGHSPCVVMAGDPSELRGDAATNFAIVRGLSSNIMRADAGCDWGPIAGWFSQADWIVDALLGTGSRGEPHGAIAELIRLANASSARRMAIDLPSGLDCDTGEPSRLTFRADQTCTMVAEKAGFQLDGAQPYLGTVHVVDIGAPQQVIDAALAEDGNGL